MSAVDRKIDLHRRKRAVRRAVPGPPTRATARTTRDKILAIRELMDRALTIARESGGKWYSKELVELVFTHPYCRIRFLEDAGIAKRQAASKYLQELEALGLLTGAKKGREVYYVNEPLLRVLVG